MSRNIKYLLVDEKTGFVTERFSMPPSLFPPESIPEGVRVVVPKDGDTLLGQVRFDLRKLRQKINFVVSVSDVRASWRPEEISEQARFEHHRARLIYDLDQSFARQMDDLRGPLAALHAEKSRQAEAGGGPLVADEADRLAILANAADQDERIAAIERERRAAKAKLKAATTEDEIAAAMATGMNGKKQ